VAFVLLTACANVASLLLARAETRQREIALRAALGASQGRLVRQLLAEGLSLALPAALIAVALTAAALRALRASQSVLLPRGADVQVDGRVLAFALGVSLLCALLFGLAPAWRARSRDLAPSLREGHQATVSGRRQRLRRALVVAEFALAVPLALGAGLMLRSLWALQRVDLGFAPDHVLTFRVSVPDTDYAKPEEVVVFYQRLRERMRAVPGVRAAGLMRALPLSAPIGDWGLDVEGYEERPGSEAKGDWQVASDGALEALGERLVRGRTFTPTDVTPAQPVALVNETMARAYWPDGDPIGKRIRMGNPERPWLTVVGIVGDVRHNGIAAPVKTKFYVPHAQFHASTGFAPRSMNVVLRTEGDPAASLPAARTALREVDPTIPMAAVRTMSDVVSASMSTPRLAGLLLAVFAALALALSAVGIYGLLAYLVSRRQQEIGIRMTIGADARSVLWLVLGQGMRLAAVGLVLGWAGALGLGRLMSTLLHGVEPYDPPTFLLAPLVLFVAALVASYLPARRASRVDPVLALRTE
jgi:putative ABC transport system permease protein